MKILVIPAWYPNAFHSWGSYFVDQAEAVASLGHNVSVLFPALYSPKWILKKGNILLGYRRSTRNGVEHFFHYLIKTHWSSWDRRRNFKVGQQLFARYLQEKGKPEIIHLQSYWNGDLALWIRRTYGIPYVITEHFTGFERGLVQGKERDLALEVFQNAQSRAAVSDVFGRKMKKAFDCDFISIPNIVPLKEFVKTPLKKNGPEIFLFVGDLLPKKNPMNLLQAFVEFCKEQPDSELRFIGDGPEQKKLKDFVQKKGLKQVSFLGRLDRQSVAKELQKASCLVSPSLHETFGVVVIEAMAVGRPSLVTQSGGPEELVARHDCGVIAEGFDDTSLLKGLRMISQRAWDSGRLSQKAQGYSPEKIGQLILKFYSSGLKHG